MLGLALTIYTPQGSLANRYILEGLVSEHTYIQLEPKSTKVAQIINNDCNPPYLTWSPPIKAIKSVCLGQSFAGPVHGSVK